MASKTSETASTAATAPKSRTDKAKGPDALKLLKDDHAAVTAMFEKYEEIKDEGGDDDKSKLATEICDALSLHADMEEAIFYPALRKALDDQDILDEAEVEHAGAKDLIAQLRSMKPGDDLYDAKVKVLGEGVKHHVKEEEGDMFKEVRGADLDLAALGAEMMAFKESGGSKTPTGRSSGMKPGKH